MPKWYESRYTGLVCEFQLIPLSAHSPDLPMCGGSVGPWGPRDQELPIGGGGWSEADAQAACLGEAIERCQSYPLPVDASVRSNFVD
jgi:hypothetical protein